ncbi:MAG TPA: glycosyltransferase [Candidatus Polarisedimenticolaceae bacterium]|nr:glycosyltransferase [Candidatus Polarisedimenticolaceae bacterium]
MSAARLQDYAEPAGADVVEQLRKLARPLAGARVVHVNSTRIGGGVAEILAWMVPLLEELGIHASWEVIQGDGEFFKVTKGLHNGLQGQSVYLSPSQLAHHGEINASNARTLAPVLEGADFVFIHDPQPAALIGHFPRRKGKWIWRCHVDVSRPHRPVWRWLREIVAPYDASIFSLSAFAQPLPHLQYIVPPSIDPLSEKNVPLAEEHVRRVAELHGLDPARPVMLQVSRFDRFKDPVGVIQAWRAVRSHAPVQLVLAGGGAADDPEGQAVLAEVREAADGEPDVHILDLPPDAHLEINALQRRAELVLQKSLREGFGLTVTEAMWKGKPVIGGDTGGIVLQVVNGYTGYRVHTPEGAAFRIRYLLARPQRAEEMGRRARRYVRENFLLTRHLREYLTLMLGLREGAPARLELS